MHRNVNADDSSVVYNPKFREYGVRVLDGGSSSIEIIFCPWCGQHLPGSLRDAWFAKLDELNLEPEDRSIPEELFSDAWWKTPSDS